MLQVFRIKPLVWLEGEAMTIFCNYYVESYPNAKKYKATLWIGNLRRNFETIEQAVNDAEKDYEERLKTCLTILQ